MIGDSQVKFTANANAALINAGSMTHSRKRNEAPLPPIYRGSPNNTPETSKSKDSKRAAPLPPQHVGLDLYEKVRN